MVQQFTLFIPALALADQGDSDHLAVTTQRLRPGAGKQRRNLLPNIINDDIHVQAEILKIGYHTVSLQ